MHTIIQKRQLRKSRHDLQPVVQTVRDAQRRDVRRPDAWDPRNRVRAHVHVHLGIVLGRQVHGALVHTRIVLVDDRGEDRDGAAPPHILLGDDNRLGRHAVLNDVQG